MVEKLITGLIALTTLLFVLVNAAYQEYWIAAICLTVGLVWIALELNRRSVMPSLFLLFFTGMAVLAGLSDVPVVVAVFGLSTTLAAWDLSRFRTRAGDLSAEFERQHLRKLAILTGAGFAIALLPTGVRIPINFVVLAGLVLVAMIVLRYAFLYFRQPSN